MKIYTSAHMLVNLDYSRYFREMQINTRNHLSYFICLYVMISALLLMSSSTALISSMEKAARFGCNLS